MIIVQFCRLARNSWKFSLARIADLHGIEIQKRKIARNSFFWHGIVHGIQKSSLVK